MAAGCSPSRRSPGTWCSPQPRVESCGAGVGRVGAGSWGATAGGGAAAGASATVRIALCCTRQANQTHAFLDPELPELASYSGEAWASIYATNRALLRSNPVSSNRCREPYPLCQQPYDASVRAFRHTSRPHPPLLQTPHPPRRAGAGSRLSAPSWCSQLARGADGPAGGICRRCCNRIDALVCRHHCWRL